MSDDQVLLEVEGCGAGPFLLRVGDTLVVSPARGAHSATVRLLGVRRDPPPLLAGDRVTCDRGTTPHPFVPDHCLNPRRAP